jgi:formylglycine-generating enzyme required for sulfatase activity
MQVDTVVWAKTSKEMVHIPAGAFLYGPQLDARELPEFWIDRTPVTNSEYRRFLVANSEHPAPHLDKGWAHPYNWDPEARTFPAGMGNHPVTLVDWYDAEAYAAWSELNVPTEVQWEKAARGTDGRRYPWGRWDQDRCNTEEAEIRTTTPVGHYSPTGDSPYGCADSVGNVWEWTTTQNRKNWVVRGGSFVNDRLHARCAFHEWDLPDSGMRFYGLRLVLER